MDDAPEFYSGLCGFESYRSRHYSNFKPAFFKKADAFIFNEELVGSTSIPKLPHQAKFVVLKSV
jgi:hypothetical protein